MAVDAEMDAVFKSSRGEVGEAPDTTVGVDPVSGNEIPMGSNAEEVRDDIPAQLSEGEYVVPADVVRFYGVKFFEDLRTSAKVGYQQMQENGRIGGEPVGMEMAGDELPFDISELQMVDDDQEQPEMYAGGYMKGYTGGGFENPNSPDQFQYSTQFNQVAIREFKSPEGKSIFIQFFNGQPLTAIPAGYTEVKSTEEQVAEQVAEQSTNNNNDNDPPPVDRPEPINWTTAKPEEYKNYLAQKDSTINKVVKTGATMLGGLPMYGMMKMATKMEDKRMRKGLEEQIASLKDDNPLKKELTDILTSLQTQDDKEPQGLKEKSGIFGGKSSIYEDLEDTDGTSGASFGDTWLGDLLGFDDDGFGVQGDSLADSLAGSRRDGQPSTSTATPTSTPSQSSNNSSSNIGTDAGDGMTWVKMENSNALTRVRDDDPRADFANDPVYDEDE